MIDDALSGWEAQVNSEAEQIEDMENWEYVPPSPINSTALPIAFEPTEEPCGTQRNEMRNAFGVFNLMVIGVGLTVVGMLVSPPTALAASGVLTMAAAGITGTKVTLNEKKALWNTCFNANRAYYRRITD